MAATNPSPTFKTPKLTTHAPDVIIFLVLDNKYIIFTLSGDKYYQQKQYAQQITEADKLFLSIGK